MQANAKPKLPALLPVRDEAKTWQIEAEPPLLKSVGRTVGPQLSVRSRDWPKLNLVLDASSSILTQSQCVKEAKRNFILELFGLLLSLFA